MLRGVVIVPCGGHAADRDERRVRGVTNAGARNRRSRDGLHDDRRHRTGHTCAGHRQGDVGRRDRSAGLVQSTAVIRARVGQAERQRCQRDAGLDVRIGRIRQKRDVSRSGRIAGTRIGEGKAGQIPCRRKCAHSRLPECRQRRWRCSKRPGGAGMNTIGATP